jgi:hypothetical protein
MDRAYGQSLSLILAYEHLFLLPIGVIGVICGSIPVPLLERRLE